MKNYPSKKIVLILFLAMFLSFSPVQTKKANAWDALAAETWRYVQDQVDYTVKGTVMGSLRQSAISLLSREMDRFISGVSRNGVRFITSWENYLIKNPTRNAQRYMNDYISHALSGRGSGASYSSSGAVFGASTVAMAGNEGFFSKKMVLGDEYSPTTESYAQNMMEVGQNAIEPKECEVTYFEEPANMFESETLANMNLYVNGGNNMPSDFERCIAEKYQQKQAEETLVAVTEGTANQGWKSEKTDGDSGDVMKPGILFKDAKANVENLPNLAITAATTIPELVAATVSKAISGLMESTIKGVERAITREADMITNSAVNQTNKAVNEYGPGALYK
ncbi:MAG TPA: hypothetical protein DCS28_03805 [Candidatus Moranbacteria bacterium]|nr:hypothetical protein [Candidatus Moranbacteria bacterium]HAT75136.1 hypothetical protein [Candidatus Moranbacteria bacterium]